MKKNHTLRDVIAIIILAAIVVMYYTLPEGIRDKQLSYLGDDNFLLRNGSDEYVVLRDEGGSPLATITNNEISYQAPNVQLSINKSEEWYGYDIQFNVDVEVLNISFDRFRSVNEMKFHTRENPFGTTKFCYYKDYIEL